MNKRQFLLSSISTAISSVGCAVVSKPARAQPACIQARAPATFVLVHGAWCGGFVYDKVAANLRAKGHLVYTPSLTGLGDRTHLMNESVNLTTHVNDVLSLLRFEELERVVLAGHSHGGLVISGVVESARDKIASLVYLDALVPGFPGPAPPVGDTPPSRGDTIPINEAFARAIGIPPEDLWKYSPHPVNSFIEEFEFTGAHSLVSRKTFVWANQWPNRESTYRALREDPDWVTHEVAARHMLMFDAPNEVAEILESAI